MRLRYITGSKEFIAAHPDIIHQPEKLKGNWSSEFGNNNPIHIEIGMGKGRFLMTLALENPQINYIGVEKYEAVMYRVLEKKETLEIPNLRLICYDADDICDWFAPSEISRIYLNFSDPWPKERHAKRRLTSTVFLDRYAKFLKRDGVLRFKTDNNSLFDFSLEQAVIAGWNIDKSTRDLHHSEFNAGNVMTEYEEKFSSMGNPINFMEISKT